MIWEFLLHYLWIDREIDERIAVSAGFVFLISTIVMWIFSGSLLLGVGLAIFITIGVGIAALICAAIFCLYRHVASEYEDFVSARTK